MLRSKRYFIELVWQAKRTEYSLPRVLLIREDVKDGDRWLAEKLDLGDKPLLDFLAEAFVEHFKKNKGIWMKGIDSHIFLLSVLPDTEIMWNVKSIDFDRGEIHLTKNIRDTFTYPMPQDISPYSDVEVGNTGATWGALMKAAAILFFTKYEEGHKMLVDIINRRIIDKFGMVVYKVDISLTTIHVTGKGVVFKKLWQGGWRERSKPNLSVGVTSVNNIYLPARFGGRGQYILPIIEYGHEHYARTKDAYLYCKPNGGLVFVELKRKYYRIKANVKANGNKGVKLALDENTWIRILRWSTGRSKKRWGIYPILHLSRHENKSGDSFMRTDCSISAIKLMIERFSSVGS